MSVLSTPSTTVRWGIVSVGNISQDFVTALQTVENNTVTAVAARNIDDAQQFAQRFGIPQAYGSYEQLARDDHIDLVYVGATTVAHFDIVKLLLNAGKNVLCEKPLTTDVQRTRELIELARQKKKFLMEGVWSRFFPAYEQLRRELASGQLGTPKFIQGKFVLPIPTLSKPKSLCASVVFETGIYALQLALLVFRNSKPIKCQSLGTLNDNNGMPVSLAVQLEFSNGELAQFIVDKKLTGQNNVEITTSTGATICVKDPFWSPAEVVFGSRSVQFEWPKRLPNATFHYPGSEGLAYEVEAVANCIREGKLESELMSLDDTLTLAELAQQIHEQLGVTFDL